MDAADQSTKANSRPNDLADLRQWFEEYMTAARLDSPMRGDNAVITAVMEDDLHSEEIEQLIRDATLALPRSERFCADCSEMFEDWPDEMLGARLLCHFDTINLEAKSRAGCRFCSLILQPLKDFSSWDTIRRIEARVKTLNEHVRASLWLDSERDCLRIRLPGRGTVGSINRDCFLGTVIIVELPTDEFLEGDPSDQSHNHLEAVVDWLHECTENHAICRESDQGDLPTRLVQIMGDYARLVHTSTSTTKQPYATLSHCWGTLEFLKLRKANHGQFQESIRVHQLPQTFRDALDIANKLGLQYIWIDSLCIIQDDREDWQRESSRMASVYGQSTINIAASSATHADQGCYLKPNRFVDALKIKITTQGERGCSTKMLHPEIAALYHRTVLESHLASRAWCCQERMLAPRNVYFGDRGILWECAEKVANECSPKGLVVGSKAGLPHRYRGQEEWQQWWQRGIEAYSAAKLTFPSDKLPALAGIAQRIHKMSGIRYIAGLWWDSSLEFHLCWMIEYGSTPRSRPAYRAPTWSWTSIDGELWTDALYTPPKLYAHVRDAFVMPLHEQSPFGEVTGGWIRIECAGLLFAHLSSDLHDMHIDNTEKPLNLWALGDCLDELEEVERSGCYLLPMLEEIRDDGRVLRGLLIRPTNKTKGEFQRVGMFFTHYLSDKAKDYPRDLEREMERQGRAIAEAVCEEVIENEEHPSETFVIKIV